MKLEWLQIDQVRNLKNQRIAPGPQLNLITGKNASGKTSILEALYILARGRSFRTPRIQDVIQNTEESLVVSAKIKSERDGVVYSGIEKEHGQQTIRYKGEKVKTISEQARNIPVVLITQDSHQLVTGGAKLRRHWLDWAMFHVEPDYLESWKQYMKALRQRNALLKRQAKDRNLYRGWEEAMVESGMYLYESREHFIEQLADSADTLMAGIFEDDIRITHVRGWPEKKTLSEALAGSWETDTKTGYTRVGPHQADIKIVKKNKEIGAFFSRGQVKLFVSLLMLSQAKVIVEKSGLKPILLVDDFTAELDNNASEYLLSLLVRDDYQAFLTTTSYDGSIKTQCQRFHVEHGTVSTSTN